MAARFEQVGLTMTAGHTFVLCWIANTNTSLLGMLLRNAGCSWSASDIALELVGKTFFSSHYLLSKQIDDQMPHVLPVTSCQGKPLKQSLMSTLPIWLINWVMASGSQLWFSTLYYHPGSDPGRA